MKCSILCFYEISFSCLKSHLFLCEFQEREPSSLNWIFYLSQHVMSIWKNIIQSVLGWTPYFNTTNSFTKHHVQSNKSFVKFLMNCNDQNCIRWFCYWMDPQLIGSTHCSPSIFFFLVLLFYQEILCIRCSQITHHDLKLGTGNMLKNIHDFVVILAYYIECTCCLKMTSRFI